MLLSLNVLWKLPGQPGQLAALCPFPAELGAWLEAEGTGRLEGRHRRRLSRFARYPEMLMFHSSTEQNEMLKTWNFPQNRRFLFWPALTSTHTHICRIINCYVMTPDYMPTSTMRWGRNPALKTPVLEQPPEQAASWHSSFFTEPPGALGSVTVRSICCGGRRTAPCLRRQQGATPHSECYGHNKVPERHHCSGQQWLPPSPVSPFFSPLSLFFSFLPGAVAKCQKLLESLGYIRPAKCTDPLSWPTGKNNRRAIAGEDRTA